MFKIDPYFMYKFGRTNSEDIMERHNVKIHEQRNWRNIPLGRGYNIKPLWSMWIEKDRAIKADEWFKKTYPKKFYSMTLYNGITECRNWSQEESYSFTSLLDKYYPKTPGYWIKIAKLREQGTLRDTHDQIYFIMLTKKQ